MLFSSVEFIFIFLPCFFALYFIVPSRKWRNVFLLIASLFFYAWGEPVYVLLMCFSIMSNYFFGLLISKSRRPKPWLVAAVTLNLGLLGVYKYLSFFVQMINRLPGVNIVLSGVTLSNGASVFAFNVLPLGISFFTFQAMSYVIDVYRKTVAPQKNPLYLGEYVAAFPQLIAGPIVRYETIAGEILGRRETLSDTAYGIRRFIYGLAKKVIIANTFGAICDGILVRSPSQYGAAGAWVVLVCYTFQIYFDFSGYSDMAIGMGRIMGFHFLENFNYPLISKSINEFWKRWHLSLTSFFRDYLYFPLGGNRVGPFRLLVNTFIVWFLTGLWHGANWNFILWGLFFWLALTIERLFLRNFLKKIGPFAHVYALFFVFLGVLLARLDTMQLMTDVFRALAFRSGTGSMAFFMETQLFQAKYLLIIAAGILCATPLPKLAADKLEKVFIGRVAIDVFTIALFGWSIIFLLADNYNPFIYFRF